MLRCCRAWPPFSPPLAQLEVPCYVDKLAARLRPGWLSAGGSFQHQVTPNGLRLSRVPSAASGVLGRLHTPRLPHAHTTHAHSGALVIAAIASLIIAAISALLGVVIALFAVSA